MVTISCIKSSALIVESIDDSDDEDENQWGYNSVVSISVLRSLLASKSDLSMYNLQLFVDVCITGSDFEWRIWNSIIIK